MLAHLECPFHQRLVLLLVLVLPSAPPTAGAAVVLVDVVVAIVGSLSIRLPFGATLPRATSAPVLLLAVAMGNHGEPVVAGEPAVGDEARRRR